MGHFFQTTVKLVFPKPFQTISNCKSSHAITRAAAVSEPEGRQVKMGKANSKIGPLPLGPLGFKCSQHTPTTRRSVEGTAGKAPLRGNPHSGLRRNFLEIPHVDRALCREVGHRKLGKLEPFCQLLRNSWYKIAQILSKVDKMAPFFSRC